MQQPQDYGLQAEAVMVSGNVPASTVAAEQSGSGEQG